MNFDDIYDFLGEPAEVKARNKMQTARGFLAAHPEVLQDIATHISEGEADPTLDIQYRVIQTVETASRANSNALASFSPSELYKYPVRILNDRLTSFNVKVLRGRMSETFLTHDSQD